MRGSTLDSAWKRGCRGREGLVRTRAVFSIEDICNFLSLVLPSQENEQLTNLMLSFSSVDCGEIERCSPSYPWYFNYRWPLQ